MQRRLFAPLGRFLLALVALTAIATLVGCSESDGRPLVVVEGPLQVDVVTFGPGLGRVEIRVTSPNGAELATRTFTPEAAAKGSLGVYLPSGTAGTVLVVVTLYDVDGNVIATSPATPVAVSPGQVTTTTVWQHAGDGGTGTRSDTLSAAADDALPALDAGTDSRTALDTAGLAEVGSDVPALDAPVLYDGPPLDGSSPWDGPWSSDAPVFIDAALDAGAVVTDTASVDATPALPVWHAAENVENDILNKSYSPVVAVDPIDQHAYVAWMESSAVKVKRWNGKSQSWEPIKTLENRGSPDGLSIGVDAKGNVMAAWYQDANGTDESLYGVWTSSSADGVAWSPPYHLSTGKTFDLRLAVARNGTARVVYEMQTATNVNPLFAAYYDGAGWTTSTTPVYDSQNTYGFNPRLIVNAAGDGYLLLDKSDSAGYTSVAASVLTGKSGVAAPVILDDNTNAGVYDRDIVLNKKGTVVAVWSEYTSKSSYAMAIKSKTYTNASGWAASATSIVTADSAYSLAAVIDETDTMTLTWQQSIAGRYNTVAARGKVDGAWGEAVPLETDNTAGDMTTENTMARMAVDSNGQVMVVWRKEIDGPDTSPSSGDKTYGMYATAYRDGAWLPQLRLFQKTGANATYPSLSVSDNGLAVAAFFAWSTIITDPDIYNALVAFYR